MTFASDLQLIYLYLESAEMKFNRTPIVHDMLCHGN